MGTIPWRFWFVFSVYCLPLVAFFYLTGKKPITTPVQVFGAAMGGEMMGGLVVCGLMNAFVWTRGQPIRARLGPIAGALFLLAVMLSVTLG